MQKTENIPPYASLEKGASSRYAAKSSQCVTILNLAATALPPDADDNCAPRRVLKDLGYRIAATVGRAPAAFELESLLAGSDQLWVIAGKDWHLGEGHLRVIENFYHEDSHSLFVASCLGADPRDANAITDSLFRITVHQGVCWDRPGFSAPERCSENSGDGALSPELIPFECDPARRAVTGTVEDGSHRAIIDGGRWSFLCENDPEAATAFLVRSAMWLGQVGLS